MTWPKIETAKDAFYMIVAKAINETDAFHNIEIIEVTDSDVEAIIDAALDGKALYEEPDRCLHRTLMYVHGADICADCGAAQRWVIQVWPTNSDSTRSRLAEGKES